MKLSIVTSIYRSSRTLKEFYEQITDTVHTITDDYEILIVNDGADDASMAIALDLHRTDDRVCVIDLSRNFGHSQAISTGVQHSKGDYVFIIDCHMDEPPSLLRQFWQKMEQSPEADMVYGVQDVRRGGFVERYSGRMTYFLIDRLSDIHLPQNMMTVRLMTRRYIESLFRFHEREAMFPVKALLAGYRQIPVTVEKHRTHKSSHSFGSKVDIASSLFISMTSRPLHYVFYAGAGISILALAYTLYLIISSIARQALPDSWNILFASVWLLGGAIVLSIGIVAIYLSTVLVETRRRPQAVVREIYSQEDKLTISSPHPRSSRDGQT